MAKRRAVPLALTGDGWNAEESAPDGTRFRWANDGAWIEIVQTAGLAYDVSFDIEPGPAVGLRPFDLDVCEESGATLATLRVLGRARVSFRLPRGERGLRRLELRARGEAEPVEAPDDARTLRFRIFSIALTPVSDLAHARAELARLTREVDARDAIIARLERTIVRLQEERESRTPNTRA